MLLNKNCFVFIQIMQRRRREDGLQNFAGISKMSAPKCQRGSSFVVGNIFFVVCQLTRWLPRFCSPLAPQDGPRGSVSAGSDSRTSPRFAARRLLGSAPQGLSPCRYGDGFQRRAFHLLLSPCQPGLVSNGKSHLGHGSFRHGAQSSRRTTYGSYGVAANGLT